MNFLPKELEDIILDYKTQLENNDKYKLCLNNIKMKNHMIYHGREYYYDCGDNFYCPNMLLIYIWSNNENGNGDNTIQIDEDIFYGYYIFNN